MKPEATGRGHGGDIASAARETGRPESEITDFSASINPMGMSSLAKEAAIRALDSACRYPDIEMSGLISALSSFHNIPPENIVAGNGSTELIYLIPRVLRPKKALIVGPAFSEYERALVLAGCRVEHLSADFGRGFYIDSASVIKSIDEDTDMVWIANPSNPAGTVMPRQDMVRLAEAAARKGAVLVVDEAFMDFCEAESIKERAVASEHLIVLRSLTKFYALAGLRVGCLFTSQWNVECILEKKEPWSVNAAGEAAAIAALEDERYRKETLSLIAEERRFLFEALDEIPLMRPLPSGANYILVRLDGDMGASELRMRLLKDFAILVRDCSNFRGLDGRYIRIAVRKRGDNERLVKALGELYGK